VSDILVTLVSRRRERARLVEKLLHGGGAALLVVIGFARMWTAPPGDMGRWLGTLEAGVGVIILAIMGPMMGRHAEAPRRRHVHENQVDWIAVLLGAVFVLDLAMERYDTGAWSALTLAIAGVLLVAGLLDGRLATWSRRRTALQVTDAGVRVGGLFRSVSFAWSEISRIDVEDAEAVIVGRDGRARRFDLRDLRHAEQVARALRRARTRLEQHAGE
jgi:hypothetical protein